MKGVYSKRLDSIIHTLESAKDMKEEIKSLRLLNASISGNSIEIDSRIGSLKEESVSRYLGIGSYLGGGISNDELLAILDQIAETDALNHYVSYWIPRIDTIRVNLPAFLLDRLRVLLRDQGRRHDRIEAVLATGDDDIVRIVARLDALDAGLGTDDGANLIAGWKRAANILKAEQKKDAGAGDGAVDPARLREPAERALADALAAAVPAVEAAVGAEDFPRAMAALAALRQPIDAFFEAVLVNDPDPDVRRNRLALLAAVTNASRSIADFSKLEG
jgi:glycyl-tRNA synthetase beta chain